MNSLEFDPRSAGRAARSNFPLGALARALYRMLPVRIRAPVSRLFWRIRLRHARFPRLPADTSAEDRGATAAPAREVYAGDIGVRVYGYLSGQFGLGESSRLYATALQAAGVPVQVYDLDLGLPHSSHAHGIVPDDFDAVRCLVDLVVVNPDYLARAIPMLPSGATRGSLRVGCWFWELEQIPTAWSWAFGEFDALLAASDFIADALRRVTSTPVVKVPLPVRPRPSGWSGRGAFGLPEDAFLFLTTFDFHSSVARKNPLGAIRAFQRAFPDQHEGVALLVKSSNGSHYPESLLSLLCAARSDSRIIVRDAVLKPAQLRGLQASSDAFVSLHRAEGFGLGLAECMAQGKPVIATGWSGNLEFMSAESAYLVGWQPVAVQPGQYPEADGAVWAEPDLDEAAIFMRRLVDAPDEARDMGRRARDHIVRQLDPVVIGRHLLQAFQALTGRKELST